MLRFIVEYMSTSPRNATEAYRRVYDSPEPESDAAKLLKNPHVAAEIDRRELEFSQKMRVTKEELAHHLLLVATADPRELSEQYQGACRHCHGANFGYMFTPAEFQRELDTHIARAAKTPDPDPLGLRFKTKGGVGYDPRKGPHPDCPECHGEGVVRHVFKDTSNLSPAGAALYIGVETKRDGIRVRTKDQGKYVDMLAQHIGMFRPSLALTGPDGGPIQTTNLSQVTTDPQQAAAIYTKLMGQG